MTPTAVYLGPDDDLPPGRESYVTIERHPEGLFAGTGHGFDQHGNWEIYSDDDPDLQSILVRAQEWAALHGINTVHVRMKVRGWEYPP
jgi:hypothetical protein